MQWTPLIIGLTIAYFIVASITTLDLRMTKAKQEGVVPPDQPLLPGWVAMFHWTQLAIFLALLFLNWKYALVLIAVKFILNALPVLETFGIILMWPFKPRKY
jgi:hypothetical protein